ncbi:hypothetical protein PSTT_10223 [Puccinia striiformis]|uniref:Uncharacterized protein n=1 Tax=Puccinia striiformis TaxID=27350 RepID=A0A2S4V5E7_9BASI|nr:hypothetical protein PSTT_10223 [Puccinia striiformis]
MASQANLNTLQTDNQQPGAQNPQDQLSPKTLVDLEAIVLRWEQRLRKEMIQDKQDSASANQFSAFNQPQGSTDFKSAGLSREQP